MTERLLAILALIALAASLLVIAWRVPHLDLITVIAIVLAMACYDFYDYFARRRPRKGNARVSPTEDILERDDQPTAT